jgi:hypothetical protein
MLIDLTGHLRYKDSNWDNYDVDTILGGFGVQFFSGYYGFIGVDAATYTNIGTGNGFSRMLKHDFDDNKDRNVTDLNIAAVKARFEGAGLVLNARAGYIPVNVGTLGTYLGAHHPDVSRPDYFGRFNTNLHSHSYRGFEGKLMVEDTLELSYAIVDRFTPEWTEETNDMEAEDGDKLSFIHTMGVRNLFAGDGTDEGGYVDLGVGHGSKYRLNAQAAFVYPIIMPQGKLELHGFAHYGQYMDKSGYEDITGEYYIGGSLVFEYTDFARIQLGHSYTSADNSQDMNFGLAPDLFADDRAFLQTNMRLDNFAWDGERSTKFAATLYFTLMGFPGLEAGFAYAGGWDKAYELDLHVYYEFPEGNALEGVYIGLYQARIHWYNDFKNEDDIRGVAGYTFSLR